MFQLDSLKNSAALFQVIEWYNTAQLGTDGVIVAAGAETAGAATNSPIAESATTYASGGVYFNPIIARSDLVTTGITNGANAWNTLSCQSNAVNNEANSVGAALYYERSTGQSKNTVRLVDSLWVQRAYTPYNAVKTGFDTAKSTYDTDKTAYETAFTANAKDGKTTVPTRPDMPSVPAAYDGPQLLLSDQTGSSPTSWTASTGFQAKTGYEAVLATSGTLTAPTYTAAAIQTHFHNRYAYYQVQATASSTAVSLTTDEVAAAFGRLGQSKAMDNASGSPFYWGTSSSATTERPGMQISVLPEYDSGTRTDWGTGDNALISVKIATFASISDFEAPTTPTAATAISVGAQALAASVLAAATVAATIF